MSIPISSIVNVLPGVLSTSGSAVDLNGMVLTSAADVPIGTVAQFASAADVAAYFGSSSTEATVANVYFAGPTNATALPGLLYFYQYNDADVAAYLRGGKLSLSLTQLQALSGTLTVTVDGTPNTSATISLSAATSFTNAASLILAGFTSPNFTVTWNAQHGAFVVTSNTTGATSTVAFASGTLADSLGLTAAQGAVLSQGAAAATPATAMASIVNITQNWAAFTTTFGPELADKQAFSLWTSQQNYRYIYAGFDSDVNALTPSSTNTWAYSVKEASQSGSVCIYGDVTHAAFVLSYVASINFNKLNGSSSLAFQNQAGLVASVTNQTDAATLLANGYNFYGSYANAKKDFIFFYNGSISGKFAWVDDFANQIWLNANLQLALVTLLTSNIAVPYNQQGYSLIRSACLDPINNAKNFGMIQTGVTLAANQVQALYSAIGSDVSATLSANGYYLQVSDASPSARVARTTPPITLYYTSGGKVQQITMSSIEVA